MGRATYLEVRQLYRLKQACRPIIDSFGRDIYLVGSVLDRPDYRDVDVRCLLPDEDYVNLERSPPPGRMRFLNAVISDWLSSVTRLPVDFQFQSITVANRDYDGKRNCLAVP